MTLWVCAFVSGHSMQVIIGDAASGTREVDIGVSQGSILGPVLLLM